ncbi:Glycosyl transferase family 2 [Brevinema andersonii]|uniref:Glycosyl transferase family 2 n=1 Tax=Brevinema andersonii TaxID=34097 RepID=A0A1I1EY22_BREAD|nr:glycosyltransferase [Brevinema andersonii]SFB92079.1 Glycosyl transferase family 2 [Brevinema andersonii]
MIYDQRGKISVVIPTYNRKIMLKKAIDSVLAQEYGNIEIIVSDNASTDGTDVMMEYTKQKIFTITAHTTKGYIKSGLFLIHI